ncbi:MAG: DUF1810 domain-containing protein [Bacilli bacterium]|nr:DUF1810 domain-containing protein [Bacilli bacterium]
MNLDRFVSAQEHCYERALEEVKSGRKESHWMWFIFPQILGLGMSDTAIFYSINDIGEAKLYLEHEVLGPRLVEISKELLELDTDDPVDVFGDIDALKLNSCMTLFDYVSDDENVFSEVIEKFYNGQKDEKTLQLIKK